MANNIYHVTCAFLRHASSYSSVRFYGRWMHRNPAKVMLPFESDSKSSIKEEKIIDLGPDILKKVKNGPNATNATRKADLNTISSSKTISRNEQKSEDNKQTEGSLSSNTSLNEQRSKDVKEKRETLLKKRKFYLSQKKVFDDKGGIIYEKLKENDSRIRLGDI